MIIISIELLILSIVIILINISYIIDDIIGGIYIANKWMWISISINDINTILSNKRKFIFKIKRRKRRKKDVKEEI